MQQWARTQVLERERSWLTKCYGAVLPPAASPTGLKVPLASLSCEHTSRNFQGIEVQFPTGKAGLHHVDNRFEASG